MLCFVCNILEALIKTWFCSRKAEIMSQAMHVLDDLYQRMNCELCIFINHMHKGATVSQLLYMKPAINRL